MAKTTTRTTPQPSPRPTTHPTTPVRERGNGDNGGHRGPGPSGSPAK